jgi:hypothetical protein
MTEERNAFIEYGTKAREEHVTYTESFVKGFVTFNCDTDVYLGIWDKTLAAGNYFLLASDMTADRSNEALVYMVKFDEEQLLDEAERAGYEEITQDDGSILRAVQNEVRLNITMEPVEVESGRYLTFLEYVAWLAMTVAETDAIRDAIFESAYQVEIKEAPHAQTGRKASKRYDPITKLHQNMSNPALYGEAGVALDVAGRGEKKKGKEVNTLVSLEYIASDDGDALMLSRELTDFDLEVYSAIGSLYENGKREVTLREIAEHTLGDSKLTPKQLDSVMESVEVLRRTLLTADVTQEAKAHGLVDPETGKPWEQMKISDFLFNAIRIDMRSTNGKITTGYSFHAIPIGLKYAKASKKVIAYDAKYLDTKSAGSNTERNVVIRGYLLRRITQAKGGKMSNTIRCETIYDKAGINKDRPTERNRVDKYVTKLLGVWEEKGLFKSYEIAGEGRRRMAKIIVSFT